MKTIPIYCTRDYSLFEVSSDNRPIRSPKKIIETMKKTGFLYSHPIRCVKRHGKLIIEDGQHRFEAAKALGLPIYYVICEPMSITIAELNGPQQCWNLTDYVISEAGKGDPDYIALLEYCSRTGIGINAAASMMTGQCSDSGNVNAKLKNRTFQIKTMAHADTIERIVKATARHVPWASHRGYIGALSRCLFVGEFNPAKYIKNINAKPYLLDHEGTKLEFLDMIERAYNHGSSQKVPLAFLARQAARSRNVVKK